VQKATKCTEIDRVEITLEKAQLRLWDKIKEVVCKNCEVIS
jgi:RNase P subunit RPR2